MKTKVLVMGGSGFVGSALVPALLDSGCNVTTLNRGSRLVRGAEQITMDRYDAAAMKAVTARFDVVIVKLLRWRGDADRL
ncbi:NAD-dependent epimerase/dehydratase (plasmid) [Mesorhizobium loti]|nr:NAD-dependent epimerase/dehydratase [Mesorhizobium loti]